MVQPPCVEGLGFLALSPSLKLRYSIPLSLASQKGNDS